MLLRLYKRHIPEDMFLEDMLRTAWYCFIPGGKLFSQLEKHELDRKE